MNTESFLILPYNLLSDKSLKLSEKIILAEIISLCRIKGYCYASNAYFSKRIGVSERTVTAALSTLENKKYVEIKIDDNCKRTVKLIYDKLKEMKFDFALKRYEKFSKGLEKFSRGVEKISEGLEKTSTNNNSYNNNKNNSYNENKNKQDFEVIPYNPKRSYDLAELMKIK